jgi:hypothetical protein
VGWSDGSTNDDEFAVTSLIEMLAGAPSPGPIIEAAKLGARFWKGPPETRLLTLLHHDFGKRAGLSRDRFWAWQKDEALMNALGPVLSGAAVPDERTAAKLADQISAKLTETDPADRPALALEIAHAALMAPTSVLRTEEKTSYLVEGSQRDGQRLAAVQETVEQTHDGISRVLRSLGTEDDDVVRALITDPLQHAGVEQRAKRAAQHADAGRHQEAAEDLLMVAAALRARGLSELAEAFSIRAAESLTTAGQSLRARELLLEALWARLDRGQPGAAHSLLSTFQATCGTDEAWIVDAVRAEVDWPELDGAADALAEAALRTTDGAWRARWWAAWAVERTVVGALDELAAEAMDALDLDDGPGACVARMLALAARMRVSGGNLAEDFELLEDWADRASDESAGTVWSLRACALAMVGDERGAIRGYRRAMTRWARTSGGAEQTGQQLLCAHAVQHLNGSRVDDLELRPVALALRGALGCPASVISRLESHGSSEMLDEDWPDARRLLSHAYGRAIASGDLQSILILESKLARLYAATGHRQAALMFALRGANSKVANALAATLPATDVADALLPAGAPWQRTASYSTVTENGVRLPPAWIAAHTQSLMADVGGPLSPTLTATPAALAPQAVSAVLHSVPDALLGTALPVVRAELLSAFVGPRRAAAKALQLITDLGRSDETALLIDEMLTPNSQARVDPEWVHARLDQEPALRERIVQAAVAGIEPALETLVYEDSVPAEVAPALRDLVERFVETSTVERSADGRELSVGMGVRFELGGMAARHVDDASRAQLVQRLEKSVEGTHEPAINRASALSALFNLAPALTAADAQRIGKLAGAIASGQVPRSRFDGGAIDPLSRFRFSFPGAEDVQAAAVELVGRLQGLGHTDIDVAREAVDSCLRHPDRGVFAAALRAETWLTHSTMPAALGDLLRVDDVGVRRAAVVLWRHIHPEVPIGPPEREQLLNDQHPALRALLAEIAVETDDRELLQTAIPRRRCPGAPSRRQRRCTRRRGRREPVDSRTYRRSRSCRQ